MELDQIETLFKWMTIINFGIMIFSAIMIGTLRGFIHKFHGRLFDLPKETLNIILYSYLGVYKIMIIVFNLVPYLAIQFVK